MSCTCQVKLSRKHEGVRKTSTASRLAEREKQNNIISEKHYNTVPVRMTDTVFFIFS